VGSCPAGASWCGALDMAGNIWQWCADWYDAKYYRMSPATAPSGPPNGKHHVMRGGSWRSTSSLIRASNRGYLEVTIDRFAVLGFRAVRSE
jgi:formylglycine-generating enzyme required for sulfatase activity